MTAKQQAEELNPRSAAALAPSPQPLEGLPGEGRPTELTRGLLAALDRPPLPAITPGPVGTVVSGLLTAGLYPAFSLPWRWLRTLRWHRHLEWHLAEWAGSILGSAQAQHIQRAHRAGVPRGVAWLALALAIGAGVSTVVLLASGGSLERLWFAASGRRTLEAEWVFLLCMMGSFVLTWLSVNLELRRLSRFDAAAMEVLGPAGEGRAGLSATEAGIRPVSLVLGVVLVLAGMFWALPMLIAATAQRRALLLHGRRLRDRLSVSVRGRLARQRPAMVLPPMVGRAHLCRNAICDQSLPAHARFCPRCGLPQKPLTELLQ